MKRQAEASGNAIDWSKIEGSSGYIGASDLENANRLKSALGPPPLFPKPKLTPPPPPPVADEAYEVVIERQAGEAFGLVVASSSLLSGKLMGEFVGQILPNSAAERCGRLRLGQQILRINGVEISGFDHATVMKLLLSSSPQLRLLVTAATPMAAYLENNAQQQQQQQPEYRASSNSISQQPSNLSAAPPPGPLASNSTSALGDADYQTISVELVKPLGSATGFGFSMRSGSVAGILPLTVLKLSPTGVAARDGRIQVFLRTVRVHLWFLMYRMCYS